MCTAGGRCPRPTTSTPMRGWYFVAHHSSITSPTMASTRGMPTLVACLEQVCRESRDMSSIGDLLMLILTHSPPDSCVSNPCIIPCLCQCLCVNPVYFPALLTCVNLCPKCMYIMLHSCTTHLRHVLHTFPTHLCQCYIHSCTTHLCQPASLHALCRHLLC